MYASDTYICGIVRGIATTGYEKTKTTKMVVLGHRLIYKTHEQTWLCSTLLVSANLAVQ